MCLYQGAAGRYCKSVEMRLYHEKKEIEEFLSANKDKFRLQFEKHAKLSGALRTFEEAFERLHSKTLVELKKAYPKLASVNYKKGSYYVRLD